VASHREPTMASTMKLGAPTRTLVLRSPTKSLCDYEGTMGVSYSGATREKKKAPWRARCSSRCRWSLVLRILEDGARCSGTKKKKINGANTRASQWNYKKEGTLHRGSYYPQQEATTRRARCVRMNYKKTDSGRQSQSVVLQEAAQ
jgi:hypothetical protein